MDFTLKKFNKFSDQRGDLIVFLQRGDLADAYKTFGQIYFVTFTQKGIIRGNHYHNVWHEWFGVVAGKVRVTLEDVKTKKRKVFILDAKKDQYTRLEIAPGIAHKIESMSKYAALLNYADGEWSEDDSIRYEIN